jgi:[acyl-carrier-protein] S-malonyltransferase
MDPSLSEGISDSALAFRGYNVTNLGRTGELLAVPAYRSTLEAELKRFGDICSEVVSAPVDLMQLVLDGHEPGLEGYAGAVALIVAVECAQLRLLAEVHGVDYRQARLAYGYSLGEMMAVCCGGALHAEDLVRVPLAMAHDCAELAHDVTMGVLFSRGGVIAEDQVRRLCVEITSAGRGTIGISSVLSPNTYLLIGQGDAVARFKAAMPDGLPASAHLRLNSHRWPPLHTPIVRQRNVPDRAAVLMETLRTGDFPPRPPVLSLVTGKRSYDRHTAREMLRQWIDQPQRLWDAVCETLAAGVETVIHIGPEPNLIPATFARLSENIDQQSDGRSAKSYGRRAIRRLVKRPWLAALLPARAALLRAPLLRHVILEDWLLEHAPRS